MDLMLNTITTPGTSLGIKVKEKKGARRSSGFSMNFSKSQPVKALVARKRVIPKTNSVKSDIILANTVTNNSESIKIVAKEKRAESKSESTKNVVKEKKAAPIDNSDIQLANTIIDTPQSFKSKKHLDETQDDPGPKKKKHKKDSSFSKKPISSDITLANTVVDFPDDAEKNNEEPIDAQKRERKVDKEFSIAMKNFDPSSETKSRRDRNFKTSKLFDRNDDAKEDHILIKQVPKSQLIGEKVFSNFELDSLDIHAHSKKNVTGLLGYTKLTEVQHLSIPKILSGKDMLIRSQTGSGKTLAYALPVVEKLHLVRPKSNRKEGIFAVVIVPTRELALQTYELFLKLLKPYTWIVSSYLCGGEKRKAEKARLRAGINILIGTPGRFCDHLLHTESLKLDTVKFLVLDEADRLLELGYEKDVKKIVDSIGSKENVQTILLSATLTASVKELAGLALKDPSFVDTADVSKSKLIESVNVDDLEDRIVIPSSISQKYVIVHPKQRLVTLSALIAAECNEETNKVLVFMATQSLVDYHYDTMVEVLTQKVIDSDDEDEDEDKADIDEGNDDKNDVLLPKVRFFKLHGKMTQIERNSVFKDFRKTKSGVLLCTDVAARGVDVPNIDIVIQYDPPQIVSDYVHRVGRTARGGEKGKAIIILTRKESEFLNLLADKKLSLKEENHHMLLKNLIPLFGTTCKTGEYAAIELQHRFEKLVSDDKDVFGRACKAFVSWVRYYSNFPKDLREIFNIKNAHMGHYAKCMALREPPKHFMKQYTTPAEDTPQNRLTEDDNKVQRPYEKMGRSELKLKKRNDMRSGNSAEDFQRGLRTSKILNISEFDSGMDYAAKKKKKSK